MTATRLRFAPSPTGYLHAGNVRTALVNFLAARKTGGQFLLRLDDTDTERSRPEYEAAIKEDLTWLGLGWDDSFRQLDRLGAYEAAMDRLIEAGRLYPCYETPDELEIRRKMLLSRGLPPIYDRSALELTEAQKSAYEQEGRKPHWRFKLEAGSIEWHDLVRGLVKFEAEKLPDPVLVREDGRPLFTFSAAVDDGETGITHVVRGEDHVTNTAVQVQIFEALGYALPQFAHLALIRTKEGELSKRVGGFDIRSLREAGIEPMAILSLLARLGTSQPVEAQVEMQALIDGFDFGHFGRAPAIYDPEELERLNGKIVHQLPFEAVKARIHALGLTQADEAFWLSVRGNLNHLSDIRDWWRICREPLAPEIEDAGFLQEAAEMLPPGDLGEDSWQVWTNTLKEKSGRKGRALFMPLRKALTGMEHGPELKDLLPLIGRERAIRRLKGEAA